MNEKRINITRLVAGILGAAACISMSILISFYAPHLAAVVSPFVIALSLACLSIAAHAAGFKLGGVFIERTSDKKKDNQDNDGLARIIHLHHHFDKHDTDADKNNPLTPLNRKRHKSNLNVSVHKLTPKFFKRHSNKPDYTNINESPTLGK